MRRRKLGFNSWVKKVPWRRKWQSALVFVLGNPMDRGTWQAPVHGVTESGTTEQLSTHRDFSSGAVVENLLCNAGEMGSIPQGAKIRHDAEQLISRSATVEPVPCNRRFLWAATRTQCSQINKRLRFCSWVPSRVPSVQFSSVHFSHSVVSDSLRPHGLQHARPPCPSTAPGVFPNSCPLSWWCYPTISSSVVPFSSCP